MPLDSASWAALALGIAAMGAVLSWLAWRRRGPVAGLRGVAWTLIPIAAWLSGTLKLVVEIAADVSSWAVHLVFSPVVWLGISAAGLSALLFVVTATLRARGLGTRVPSREVEGAQPRQVPPSKGKRKATDDDVDDEIAAILRRHNIS
ncbi:MAG: cellulose synthase [Actinomycetota bacterium]|nr:cellulose synthase [Actinomycetota bacterium]